MQTVVNMSVTGCRGRSLLGRKQSECRRRQHRIQVAVSLHNSEGRSLPLPSRHCLVMQISHIVACALSSDHLSLSARRCRQLIMEESVCSPCCSIITEAERENRRSVDGGGVRVMGLVVVVGGLS